MTFAAPVRQRTVASACRATRRGSEGRRADSVTPTPASRLRTPTSSLRRSPVTAHNLPDTAEIREQMGRAETEALAALGLDATTVAVWEDGYRAAKTADSTF